MLHDEDGDACTRYIPEQRAEKKVAKYGRLAAAVSSQFRPAVVERFGACCDALVGLVRMLCGERERDALRDGDYTFAASSRSTYAAGLLTFSVVMADAAMIERVISCLLYTSPSPRD